MQNNIKKIKTAIFISGRGSNMESLIKATKNQEFPASISLVLTNNSLAPGIKLAKKHNIPVKKFDKKKFNSSQFEFNSQKVLLNFKIEMICLAGFMQILSKEFLGNWKNKIINIHPSYLPNNKGLNAQKQALDENADFTGCTVHFVNEEIDNGKIILQEKVKIMHNDSVQTLSDRILEKEHIIYPRALKKIASEILKIKNL